MDFNLESFQRLAADRGCTLTVCQEWPHFHLQLRGTRLVNYYPTSRKRTLYAPATGGLKPLNMRGVLPTQAVDAAMGKYDKPLSTPPPLESTSESEDDCPF